MVMMPMEKMFIAEELCRLEMEKKALLEKDEAADRARLAWIEAKIRQLKKRQRILDLIWY